MKNDVQRIVGQSGKRRLDIFENEDGTFSFDELRFDEQEKCFCLLRPRSGTLGRMASLKECLAEAKGRIPWVAEAIDDASTP